MKCVNKIWIDGGTRNNNICLVDGQTDQIIVKKRGVINQLLTNNELEYLALIYGLEYCNNVYPNKNVIIFSDSMLIVNQINGKWRITTDRLLPLYKKCVNKLNEKIKIVWLSRKFNLAGHVLEKP